jgi:hypothetical protein
MDCRSRQSSSSTSRPARELDAALRPIASRYLGDPEAIRAAAEAVRRQAEKPR